mgnify:CR=1 FL=1
MLLAAAMTLTFMPLSVFAATTGNVEINGTNFPDTKFQEYLKTATRPYTSEKIDKNEDGKLSEEERNLVYRMDVKESGIKDLTGIQWFPNLVTLDCSKNQLTSLNLSSNNEIVSLNCDDNQLTELDLRSNSKLEYLNCGKNKLTQLILPTTNNKLKILNCYSNQLTALDMSRFENLTDLYCGANPLGTLNVTSLKKLQYLGCGEDGLTTLDVTQNPHLESLICDGNQLTELDLSSNTALRTLSCSKNKLTQLRSNSTDLTKLLCTHNQLSSLDVTQSTMLQELDCGYNYLTELDVHNNVNLEKLICERNRLAYLNLDANTKINDYYINFRLAENAYPVEMKSDRTVDLSQLPNGFDMRRLVWWYDATRQGNILTVDEGVTKVKYTYLCRGDTQATFYLDVSGTVPPVTPPSGGDNPGGGSTGGGSTGGSTGGEGGGGGGAVVLLAGGAALLGGVGIGVYNYVTNSQLKALLPAGTPVPENRAQTALLLWNTAGRPEPAAAPAFVDIADPDTAKAAQWCVEAGLLEAKSGISFDPYRSISRTKVLKAYKQLR